MRNQLVAAVTAAVMGLSGFVVAKVSPAEAERLNNELTPVGAERAGNAEGTDRKSTRLNSSHVRISYAVFCLKKKKKQNKTNTQSTKTLYASEQPRRTNT